jgi:hypothetical protein
MAWRPVTQAPITGEKFGFIVQNRCSWAIWEVLLVNFRTAFATGRKTASQIQAKDVFLGDDQLGFLASQYSRNDR